MAPVHIDALVRLQVDLPSLGLREGAEGVVKSVWLSPEGVLCEVEFPASDAAPLLRGLVRAEQLRAVAP